MQQAARSKAPGDSFPLNGDSINVGNFEDIRSAQTEEDESVSIGFDMCIPYSYFDSDYQGHLRNECRDDIDYSWMKEAKEKEDCSFCASYCALDDWLKGSTTDESIIRWQVDLGAEQTGSPALSKINFTLADTNGDEKIYISINRQEEYNKAITLSGALPNDYVIQQITACYLAFLFIEVMMYYPKDGLPENNKGAKKVIEYAVDDIVDEVSFEFPETIAEIPELIDLGRELIKTGIVSHFSYPLYLVPVIASLLDLDCFD